MGGLCFLQKTVDHISKCYHHSKKLYHDDENEIKRDVIGGRWPLRSLQQPWDSHDDDDAA